MKTKIEINLSFTVSISYTYKRLASPCARFSILINVYTPRWCIYKYRKSCKRFSPSANSSLPK